jgi:hypothetical protein
MYAKLAPYRGPLLWGIVAVFLIWAIFIFGLRQAFTGNWAPWTGFGWLRNPETQQIIGNPKTLWDWLNLLVVPLVIAYGVTRINETTRAAERASALSTSLDSILNEFMDDLSRLLLDHKLRETLQGSEARTVARGQTLVALDRLDGKRRGQLLRFVHELDLLRGDKPILDLNGANLKEAELQGVDLQGANLQGADLQGANLQGTNLEAATLKLREAASLKGALRGNTTQ